MTNAMDGGIFDDRNFYQIIHICDMGFNPKALKELWSAIKNNPTIKNKEKVFEKFTFDMLNRTCEGWMK